MIPQCIISHCGMSDRHIKCKFHAYRSSGNTQINNVFATLDQTGPKHAKRGIIHSLFNFLLGDPNSSAKINPFKNNLAILEENQDILSG